MTWRCLTCTHEGSGAPPDRCPACDSERYADHGAYPAGDTERVPGGIGWRRRACGAALGEVSP